MKLNKTMVNFKKLSRSQLGKVILSTIAAGYIKFVRMTSTFTTIGHEPILSQIKKNEPFIVAFWHGRLLMAPTGWPAGVPLSVMISHHHDGELIYKTSKLFGINAVRGSSSNGGSSALRKMVKILKSGEFVGITPDGPRGPRMRAQMGVITLSQISGVPIFPATYSVSRRKILNSWDKFIIALPFSKGVYVWGKPISIPRNATSKELENKRIVLESSLNTLCKEADKRMGVRPIEAAVISFIQTTDKR